MSTRSIAADLRRSIRAARRGRRAQHALLLALFLFALTHVAAAQTSSTGTLRGSVTTQAGAIALPGALATVLDASRTEVAMVVTEEDGHFTVGNLPPGEYTVVASLAGFVTATKTARVNTATVAEVSLDLLIGGFSETVKVEASTPVTSEGTLATTEKLGGKELEVLAPSGGLPSVMRLFADVIQVPGGISIKGGRPSQASFQLGSTWIVNPATGLLELTLPDDAIEAVSVLPNPYAVEYGRFSSGLTVIQTREGGNEWKLRLNVADPSFRYKRGSNPFNIVGLGWYAPRFEVSGPLVKNRMFLEQAGQYRYQASEVGSLPQNQVSTSHSFSSFTRVDGTFSPRHSFVATATLFPSKTDSAGLGTFVPPAATVGLRSHTTELSFTDRGAWTDSVATESTVQMHVSSVDTLPQGQAPMELLPQTTLGNFFNEQHRNTRTIQVIESLTASTDAPGGRHLFKVGLDLLHNEYDASSLSRPVLIERENGTLARRLDFSPGIALQTIGSSDVALFGQDRFQPWSRWYTEFGFRLDHDGITDRFNPTPRVGSALLLNESGSAVLRGGVGVFYERTPSIAGVFSSFGSYTDTQYAADGLTPLGPSVPFTYATSGRLETPRSQTWDIGFDQQINKNWTLHVGNMNRAGSHELIVNPVQNGATGAIALSSTGKSSYRGVDVGVHFADGPKADATVSYTHARAREDLNALTTYFDTILHPVIESDAYAASNSDVPNRLLARGRYMPQSRWLFLGIFDWRNGLPYSTVDERLEFVGPRNALRLPTYHWLLLGVEHQFTILKLKPWIGVHVWNALGSPLYSDVQANVGSSAFGTLYNPTYRQYHVQLRFDR